MALPHRRQQLANFTAVYGLTHAQLAEAIGVTPNEVTNLVKGVRYPSPRELEAISKVFNGLPVEVFFEPELLKYRDHVGVWPPKGRGFRPARAE